MNRSAFTLVELLVVIIILGLLLALLAPAGEQVWAVARATICRNNLFHIYQTFGIAAADARLTDLLTSGKTPFFPKPEEWTSPVFQYSETSTVLVCPEIGGDATYTGENENVLSRLVYINKTPTSGTTGWQSRNIQIRFDDPAHQGLDHMHLGTRTGEDANGPYIEIGLDDNSPVTQNYMDNDGHDGIIRVYLDVGGKTVLKLMQYSCGEYNCVLFDNEPLFTDPADPPEVNDPSHPAYGWLGPKSSKRGMEVELGGPTSTCSYGMAKGAELFGAGHHKIIVMDYDRLIIDPTLSYSRDLLQKAGRHMGHINILFTDGSIISFSPTEIDPLIPRNADFWSL